MRLLRIIGAIIIFFSALMIAHSLSSKIDREIKAVSALRTVLERTRSMIECYSLSASEILRRIDSRLFLDCGIPGGRVPQSFGELADNIDIADVEMREAMLSFAKDFGKSYRADELSRCTLYLEKIRAREQKIIKESAKKKKVIYAVAICSSLAAVILMI